MPTYPLPCCLQGKPFFRLARQLQIQKRSFDKTLSMAHEETKRVSNGAVHC